MQILNNRIGHWRKTAPLYSSTTLVTNRLSVTPDNQSVTIENGQMSKNRLSSGDRLTHQESRPPRNFGGL
jgi:hypothetical protein